MGPFSPSEKKKSSFNKNYWYWNWDIEGNREWLVQKVIIVDFIVSRTMAECESQQQQKHNVRSPFSLTNDHIPAWYSSNVATKTGPNGISLPQPWMWFTPHIQSKKKKHEHSILFALVAFARQVLMFWWCSNAEL